MPLIPCAYPPCGRMHHRPPSAIKQGCRHCSRRCRELHRLEGGWTLHKPGRNGRRKYVWEPWMDELMRQEYDSQSATLDRLEQQLRVPRQTIKQRANVLGITRTQAPPWSDRETAYLRRQIGRTSLAAIATHLGRTKNAVIVKAQPSWGMVSRGVESVRQP